MKARRLCDAYFRALIPRRTDSNELVKALSEIPLPPTPRDIWFWERVVEEYVLDALNEEKDDA